MSQPNLVTRQCDFCHCRQLIFLQNLKFNYLPPHGWHFILRAIIPTHQSTNKEAPVLARLLRVAKRHHVRSSCLAALEGMEQAWRQKVPARREARALGKRQLQNVRNDMLSWSINLLHSTTFNTRSKDTRNKSPHHVGVLDTTWLVRVLA